MMNLRGYRIGLPFVLSLSAWAQNPQILQIVNGLSHSPSPICRGMIAIASGINLSDGATNNCVVQTSQQSKAPYDCAGLTLMVNGTPAPVLSVSPSEVMFQVPTLVGTGIGLSNTIQVFRQGANSTLSSAPFSVRGVDAAPGIAAELQGGILTGQFYNASGLVTVSNPALPGEYLWTLATGLGPSAFVVQEGASVTPADNLRNYTLRPIILIIGGQTASLFTPTLVPLQIGVFIVRFTLPLNLSAGFTPVLITANTGPSAETGAAVHLQV